MPTNSGDNGVVDKLYRVSGASVFRITVTVVVRLASDWIDNYILQHGAETNRVVDLRLAFFRQFYALCVTTTLEVEDPAGAPTVLVIADKTTTGIGGESCLAGAGE